MSPLPPMPPPSPPSCVQSFESEKLSSATPKKNKKNNRTTKSKVSFSTKVQSNKNFISPKSEKISSTDSKNRKRVRKNSQNIEPETQKKKKRRTENSTSENANKKEDYNNSTVETIENLGSTVKPADELILNIKNPNEIEEGKPRSGNVKIDFSREEALSGRGVANLLQRKHDKLVRNGYTSLIGKVANDIDKDFYNENYNPSFVKKLNIGGKEISFKKDGDIKACYGTYENIIKRMINNNECTLKTASQMLKNLSLPHSKKNPKAPESLSQIDPKMLFYKLEREARKLMAVFICEAIRFQEDGALARMAIRKVISLFPKDIDENKQITEGKNPFYDVFVANAASIIFPLEGGKNRMLAIISNGNYNSNGNYDTDLGSMRLNADYLSDVEEESSEPVEYIGRTDSRGRPLNTPARFKGTPGTPQNQNKRMRNFRKDGIPTLNFDEKPTPLKNFFQNKKRKNISFGKKQQGFMTPLKSKKVTTKDNQNRSKKSASKK